MKLDLFEFDLLLLACSLDAFLLAGGWASREEAQQKGKGVS